MRISDWSSDVCSSDLPIGRQRFTIQFLDPQIIETTNILLHIGSSGNDLPDSGLTVDGQNDILGFPGPTIDLPTVSPFEGTCFSDPDSCIGQDQQIGRASCRESICK